MIIAIDNVGHLPTTPPQNVSALTITATVFQFKLHQVVPSMNWQEVVPSQIDKLASPLYSSLRPSRG
jgi:hypothetical protein